MTQRVGPAKRPLVGAQISTAGGFAPVPERAVAIGAEVVQIFSSNPRMWPIGSPDPEGFVALAAGLRKRRLPLFFHTVYLINLASPDEHLRLRSIGALSHSLVTGALAGAAGVVTHVGSHKGEGFGSAIERVVDSISMAGEAARASLAEQGLKPLLPPLLLETSVGAGTTVGSSLEELAALVSMFAPRPQPAGQQPSGPRPPDVGLCLDTAHMFAAGYPVHQAEGLDSLVNDLRRRDLLARVSLVHLNDSSAPFASNRDRHENPGEGQIGYEGLARVVRHRALAQVPFVLEVPGADGHGPDAANVAVVKSMREGAPRPPGALARGA
jgi:deoxyribonuclease-4